MSFDLDGILLQKGHFKPDILKHSNKSLQSKITLSEFSLFNTI